MPYGQFGQVKGNDRRSIQRQEGTKPMIRKPGLRSVGSQDVPKLRLQRLLAQLSVLRRRPLPMDTREASGKPRISIKVNHTRTNKQTVKASKTHCWIRRNDQELPIRRPSEGLISEQSEESGRRQRPKKGHSCNERASESKKEKEPEGGLQGEGRWLQRRWLKSSRRKAFVIGEP